MHVHFDYTEVLRAMRKTAGKMLIIFVVLVAIMGMDMAYTRDDVIRVYLNGKEIIYENPPMLVQDRTMVPLRATMEALGLSLDWRDQDKRIEMLDFNANLLVLYIENTYAYENGRPVKLDVPPFIVESRTYVPLRFVAENFNVDVEYDEQTGNVLMTAEPQLPKQFYVFREFADIPMIGQTYTSKIEDQTGVYFCFPMPGPEKLSAYEEYVRAFGFVQDTAENGETFYYKGDISFKTFILEGEFIIMPA